MSGPQLPRSALITADHGLSTMVRETLSGPDRVMTVELEINAALHQFGEHQIKSLRALGPEVILLDLETGPELGLQLAQFLLEQNPAQVLIATGPLLSSEQLLHAMRAGISEYLPKPIGVEDLRAAMHRAVNKLRKPGGEQEKIHGRILSFFSPKGGGGSTTLATNLAIVIHRTTHKKTLLVDLDLELGESALVLGIQPRFNFVDFVENFRRMDAGLLASYIERHESGVHLLSAPFQPEKAEAVTAEQIRRILSFLKQHYEYIVVDTPRSFAPPTLAVFEQADLVFIVSNVDLPSLRNVQRGFPMLKKVLSKGEEQLRLILNRYDPDDSISPADVERSLGMKVFWKIRNDYESVMGSVNSGKPIVLNGGSPYTRDVKALASALTGVPLDTKGGRGRILRLLGAPFRAMRRKTAKSEGKGE